MNVWQNPPQYSKVISLQLKQTKKENSESVSRVQIFEPPWTVARQPPLSMGFSRQEYWSGLPFSSAEDLPDPGTEPTSLVSPELAGGFFTTSATWEAPPTRDQFHHLSCKNQNRLPT